MSRSSPFRMEDLHVPVAYGEEFGGVGRAPGGLTLSWRRLSVWGKRKVSSSFWNTRYERNLVLDKVNGSIESGTLTAIMGPSGAGKTTLMAAVSMRVQGDMSGELLLNGRPVSRHVLASISGFVPQQDLAIPSLSVKEHMNFMARMKMDRHTTEAGRKKRVKELVREMGIGKSYNTLISALSGGEQKRLSLAVQLINDPQILFCDEPTTGLDSWGAASVVTTLRTLAAAGRAVLCVLHQPASGTFQLFHRLMLLSGGRVAYLGPLDQARSFFSRQHLHCPVGYNEAEFFVNMVSTEERSRTVCKAWDITDRTTLPNLKTNGHHEMSNGKAVYKPNPKCATMARSMGETEFQHYISIETPGILIQFYWLFWRNYVAAKNDKRLWTAQALGFLGIALLLAIPYQNVLLSIEQHDIQNVQGLMYLIVTETIFTFIYSVFNQFPSEISILLRELANGLYTPAPYYLSKMLFQIPRAVIEPAIYTTLIFWIVGLKGGFFGYLIFLVPVIFAANCAVAYGTWLSASFESIATASLVSVPIDFVGYMFAGNFINLASISVYVGWIRYLSIFYYAAEAVSILQWGFISDIQCDVRAGLPCIRSGGEVLDFLGFGPNNFVMDLLGMTAIYFAFHLGGFLALLRRSKKQPVY